MNQQLLARYYILLAIFVIGSVFFGIIAIRYIKNRNKRSSEISLIWVTVIEKVLVYGIPILLLFYAIRFASDLPYVIKGDYATKTGVITEKSMNDIKIDGKWYSIYGECWYGEGNTATIDYLPHTKFAEISGVKTINHKVRKKNNKVLVIFIYAVIANITAQIYYAVKLSKKNGLKKNLSFYIPQNIALIFLIVLMVYII